jgi:hypothetical protein
MNVLKIHVAKRLLCAKKGMVEGAKTITPPKSNTYKCLPITNNLLP